jgi:hypothetical protein
MVKGTNPDTEREAKIQDEINFHRQHLQYVGEGDEKVAFRQMAEEILDHDEKSGQPTDQQIREAEFFRQHGRYPNPGEI